jgi:hypothetical protein
MTLLVTVFAAIISTIVWYVHAPEDRMKVHRLCFIFWGASLMWFVDACFEYSRLHAAYFTPSAGEMLNGLFLGLAVTALAMIIWLVSLLVSDPEGKVRASLLRRTEEKKNGKDAGK